MKRYEEKTADKWERRSMKVARLFGGKRGFLNTAALRRKIVAVVREALKEGAPKKKSSHDILMAALLELYKIWGRTHGDLTTERDIYDAIQSLRRVVSKMEDHIR